MNAASAASETPSVIEFQQVTVTRGRRRVLHDVSFLASPGGITALLGPNGSGKSTLLALLSGSRLKTDGRVLLDGHDVAQMNGRRRAARIGVLGQHDDIDTTLTAAEMVEIGARAADGWRHRAVDAERAVERALHEAGAAELAHLPFAELSGGERQRVLYARAIVRDPQVIILDEPTNHLDVRHQFELLEHVRRSGRTAIVALHTIDLAVEYADRAVVLDRGATVTVGDPRTVITPRLIREVFGVTGEYVSSSTGQRLILRSP